MLQGYNSAQMESWTTASLTHESHNPFSLAIYILQIASSSETFVYQIDVNVQLVI